jgi:hypothetical protein
VNAVLWYEGASTILCKMDFNHFTIVSNPEHLDLHLPRIVKYHVKDEDELIC